MDGAVGTVTRSSLAAVTCRGTCRPLISCPFVRKKKQLFFISFFLSSPAFLHGESTCGWVCSWYTYTERHIKNLIYLSLLENLVESLENSSVPGTKDVHIPYSGIFCAANRCARIVLRIYCFIKSFYFAHRQAEKMHIVLLWYLGIYSFKRIAFVICFWRFMVHQKAFLFLVQNFCVRMTQTLIGCTRLILSCESQTLIQKLTWGGSFSLKYKNSA